MPGSWVLVHFIEQQLEGWTFSRDHWPLHMTLVPWFATKDEEAVMRSLDRLADSIPPFILSIGAPEPFGAHGKLANVIINQGPARAFHQKLLKTIQGADAALHNAKFVGQEYRAHITRHKADGRHSNEGERVLMNDFHLVRLIDANTCLVEQQFLLKRH
jgi:2'-5' RNA ligase